MAGHAPHTNKRGILFQMAGHAPHANKRGILFRMAGHALGLALVAAAVLLAFRLVGNSAFFMDEGVHFQQITLFREGRLELSPRLTMLPGYHALTATAMRLFDKSGRYSARFFSTAISLATILVFYLLSGGLRSFTSLAKTFQFAFLPILFPFFPLIYTDVLSLLLVLIGLYLTLGKRYNLGALTVGLSLLVRQNNIVWLGLLYALAFSEYCHPRGWLWLTGHLRPDFLRRAWVFWLGLAGFLLFLLVNGGVAMGDDLNHPSPLQGASLGLHAGNLYLLLFLSFFLFLPLHLANLPTLGVFLWRRPWVLLLLLAFFLVYLPTFVNSHPYNVLAPQVVWRNRLLMAATASPLAKTLFFLPLAAGLLSVAVTPLAEKRYYWLYPFTALALLPAWLVEPRYYFVPLALFILFRRPGSPLEWVQAALNVCLVALSFTLTLARVFFV